MASTMCLLLAVLGLAVNTFAADAGIGDSVNIYKACDPVEWEQACLGVFLPKNLKKPGKVWDQPTCCKFGYNPARNLHSFFCFPQGTDTCTQGMVQDSLLEAQGAGDPQIAAFDGRVFEFSGTPGKFYNLLSEKNHQLNGHFTPAHMWDHNGTYITTMGLKYKDQAVRVHVVFDGSLEVEVNDLPLIMPDNDHEMKTTLTPGKPSGQADTVELVWQYYRKDYGHAVEISTPMLSIMIWSATPGPDAGGVMQPAYLNFQTTLLAAPTGEMHGLLGQSYERAVALQEAGEDGEMDESAPDFVGDEEDYAVAHLFAEDFQHNRFNIKDAANARRLMERDPLAAAKPFVSMSARMTSR